MVAGTERGLLLTCLWYIREVDPQTLLLTGLTRDGVYLVEGGEVVGAVNNFRFNESPVDLLHRVDEVGGDRDHAQPRVRRVLPGAPRCRRCGSRVQHVEPVRGLLSGAARPPGAARHVTADAITTDPDVRWTRVSAPAGPATCTSHHRRSADRTPTTWTRGSTRYLISMGIRTVCVVLAVVVDGPLRWVFVVGAIVLPYVAVVMANARGERRQRPPRITVPTPRGRAAGRSPAARGLSPRWPWARLQDPPNGVSGLVGLSSKYETPPGPQTSVSYWSSASCIPRRDAYRTPGGIPRGRPASLVWRPPPNASAACCAHTGPVRRASPPVGPPGVPATGTDRLVSQEAPDRR